MIHPVRIAWLIVFSLMAAPLVAEEGKLTPAPIPLWPGVAPGEKGDIGEEHDTTKPNPKTGKTDNIIRLGNVSKPTITVFKPAAEKDTGAAVVVCPGGGYSILAWDLEGTEVCDWLNSVGVTGVLLKYRVPARKGLEKHTAALQDVQRAIGMVRQHAGEWKIDPKRIGVLGFSAGGHLAAAVSNNYGERTYSAVDDADKESCRPDFTVLVYPAYLATKEDLTKLSPEMKVTKETPPTILIMTEDDPIKVENVYTYALALKANKVPAEVHTYPTGGHGYGLRPTQHVVTTWPARVADWMKAQGLLKKE
jgi:acetyl esterase/lipase